MDILAELTDLWEEIPPEVRDPAVQVILAILAFMIIWSLRHIFLWLLLKPAQRLASRTEADWDDVMADILQQPARYIALALGLLVAVQIIELGPGVTTFIQRLARSLIIIAVFVGLFKAVDTFGLTRSRLVRLTGIRIEDALLPFIRTALKLIIIVIAILIVVQEWDYNINGLIAGLGLGGLAFSLAAQDTVANLFGFSTIVGDRPFDVGDFIVTPDVIGIIEKVGLRSTRVRRLDQALVIVPNATLASSVITNWSRLRRRWIELRVGVTYGTSPDQMEELLTRIAEMLAAREKVDASTVQVMFDSFGDSALEILIRTYVYIADWFEWMKEKEAVNLEIMRIVEAMGLSIAFPSRSLYLEQLPPGLDSEKIMSLMAGRPGPAPADRPTEGES